MCLNLLGVLVFPGFLEVPVNQEHPEKKKKSKPVNANKNILRYNENKRLLHFAPKNSSKKLWDQK